MEPYAEVTIPAVFWNRVERYGERPCVYYRGDAGGYEPISWAEMGRRVRSLSCWLMHNGVGLGDVVALFSPNRPEWWIADLAILSCGAVNAPVYATSTAEEVRYILDHCDACICFAGTVEHLQKIRKVRPRLPRLKKVVVLDETAGLADGEITLSRVLSEGAEPGLDDEFRARLGALEPETLMTLIYTSGTTGAPKGVMLSHGNIMANVRQFMDTVPVVDRDDHILLSFLPLSHVFERTVTYYGSVAGGSTVYFARDITTVLDDFLEVRPTLFASVPRLYEKIHSGIVGKVEQATPLKRRLFAWAMDVGRRNLPYICNGRERSGLFALEYALADRLVFARLKQAIGMDRLQFAGSGGGPLSQHDAEFFLGLGISVLEGFGLSETSPVTNFNTPGHIRPGSVGRPLVRTEVRIDVNGELLVRGPQVMQGYYKNDAATNEALDDDGWVHTGDLGRIDEEGNLRITGRLKDIIVTAGGKNISPQNLENNIKRSIYIEQVAIIGDRRKYLTALVVPNFEELENWARARGIETAGRHELISHPDVIALFQHEVEHLTDDFARVEQIKKFTLLTGEWSQDTGELTPTLKVKRRIIESRYATEIDRMYPMG